MELGGCGGGALDNVWTWLTTKGNGITSEKCNPYDPWCQYPTCAKKGSCTNESVTDHLRTLPAASRHAFAAVASCSRMVSSASSRGSWAHSR